MRKDIFETAVKALGGAFDAGIKQLNGNIVYWSMCMIEDHITLTYQTDKDVERNTFNTIPVKGYEDGE